MGKAPKALSPQAQAWVEARKRYHLAHAQVQMARELGLNPRKRGKLASHRQEPWKVPLPEFIEYLYRKEVRPGAAPGRHPGGAVGATGGGWKAVRDAAAPAKVGGSAEGRLT